MSRIQFFAGLLKAHTMKRAKSLAQCNAPLLNAWSQGHRKLNFYCCALVAAFWGFGTGPLSAEMLLATFTVPGHEFDPGIQRPAHMSFGAATREPLPGGNVSFVNEYTPDQVGSVYEVPSILVAQMAPLFSDPSGYMFGVTMRDHFDVNMTSFWSHSRVMPHVPQRGIGLDGYSVRRITQTVDYITWTTIGSTLVGNAQQSVRFYGEAIPEPPTLAMITIGCFLVRCVWQQRK